MSNSTPAPNDTQRLDKWLWAARFYKTRALAVEAIDGGKVHVNGQRAKPSRLIRVGDSMTLSKPPYSHSIRVLALNPQRRPAAEAMLLYEESAESLAARQAMAEHIKQLPLGTRFEKGRPSKRDRRHIVRFTRGDA